MKPLLCLLFAAWAAPVFAAAPAVVSSGAQASVSAAGNSFNPTFSADGQHLVFVSHANNLVTNDDLGLWLDVFVRDLVTSNTLLVSVSTNGFGGVNADANFPSISSNGQFIAFASRASNLTAGDTNNASDVFVRDMVNGLTRLVSVDLNGGSPIDPAPSLNIPLSGSPQISADGRWVFFESRALNLVAGGAPLGSVNIYARDTWSNTTVLVTVDTNGLAASGKCELANITPNGRFAVFTTTNNSLVPGVANITGDVYRRDLETGTTIWATTNMPARFNAPYRSLYPLISADGQFVVFMGGSVSNEVFRYGVASGTTAVISTHAPWFGGPITSLASNTGSGLQMTADAAAVAFEADGAAYVWFAASNAIHVVTTCPDPSGLSCAHCGPGGQISVGIARQPALSGDGRYAVFLDVCDVISAHRHDLLTSSNQLALRTTNGGPVNAQFAFSVLNSDGSLIAFQSSEGTIAAGDGNGASDVFLRDMNTGVTELITQATPTKPAKSSFAHSFLGLNSVSADGRYIVSTRYDDPSAARDTNGWQDVFVSDALSGANVAVSINSTASGPFLVIENTNAYQSPMISANGSTVVAVRRGVSGNFTSIAGVSTTNGSFISGGFSLAVRPSPGFSVTGNADSPSLSADGKLLAFRSDDTQYDYDFPDSNGFSDVWLRYPRTLEYPPYTPQTSYTLLSGESFANGPSIAPLIAADGGRVLFATRAGNLLKVPAGGVAGQYANYQILALQIGTNNFPTNVLHGFPRRLCTYTISFQPYTWIDDSDTNIHHTNLNAILTPVPVDISNAVFSANQRFVVYAHADGSAIWRHDLSKTQTNYTFVSYAPYPNSLGSIVATNLVPSTANTLVCSNGRNPSVSADGNVVTYERVRSLSSLVDLFAVDLNAGLETPVSGNVTGGAANGTSTTPFISGDGRYVVFQSKASDLVANDTNGLSDIFVRDRLLGVTMLVSANAQGRGGNGASTRPVLAADGRVVAFQSFASDLAGGDFNDRRDVFLLKLGGADSEGDGMDDDWEMAYFNTLARDGSGDFDNDGVSDLAEFRAGTDPTNSNSVFRVLTVAPVGGGSALLLWTGNPARTYRAEFKDDLGATNWTALGGSISWNGATAALTDASATNSAHRYYRVLRLP